MRNLRLVPMVLCALALAPSSALAASFSAPVQVERSYTFQGRFLTAVSCPSRSLCVAVDATGRAEVSTNPTGGRRHWRSLRIDAGHSLTAVSCPSKGLCVAVDTVGNVISSTHPRGGAGSWHLHHVVASSLSGISCPSRHLCVAVDGSGDVLATTAPTGAAWPAVPIDAGRSLTAVSCASTHLCVAVDDHGFVLSSADPLGSASAWHAVHLPANALTGIACPSASLCVAGGSRGAVFSSRHPRGAAGTWHRTRVDVPTFGGHGSSNDNYVTTFCATARLCFAVDALGSFLHSSNPGASPAHWHSDSANGGAPLNGGSCPSLRLCVVVDGGGGVTATTRPRHPRWRTSQVDGYFQLTPQGVGGITCASASFCFVLAGNRTYFSSHPTRGASAWHRVKLGFTPSSLSCPTKKLCVAAAPATIYTSRDPLGGPRKWRQTPVDPYNGLGTAISCSRQRLCAAIDESGKIAVSTNPTGGRHAWHVFRLDSFALSNVTCTGRSLCVASDDFGNLFSSRRPTHSGWSRSHFDGSGFSGVEWSGLSCPSLSFCVAYSGGDQEVAYSSGPGSPLTWNAFSIGSGFGGGTPTPNGLSCPSSSLCLGVDGNDGQVAKSVDPAGGSGAWSFASAGSLTLAAIACPTSHLCLVGDQNGRVRHTTNPGG